MSDSCNPVDWSLPSSIHGISQVRILEWVALSFSIEIALLFQQFLFYNFWVFSHTTGITHFIELCLPVLHRYCAFYQLKVCSNSALSKSISAIFSKAVMMHFGYFLLQSNKNIHLAFKRWKKNKMLIFKPNGDFLEKWLIEKIIIKHEQDDC